MLLNKHKKKEETMFIPLLLTPMMLASEPVQLQMPDSSYDHQSQVSNFKGQPSNVLKATMTYTNTQTDPGGGHSDTDGDSDT
jgi:hypothetical protein